MHMTLKMGMTYVEDPLNIDMFYRLKVLFNMNMFSYIIKAKQLPIAEGH